MIRYMFRNAGVGLYDLWEYTEEGQPLRSLARVKADTQDTFQGLVKVVNEMNRLAQLVDDTANQTRIAEHTRIQLALLKNYFSKEDIDKMQEYAEPPPPFSKEASLSTADIYWLTVTVEHYNRIIRTFKEIVRIAFPPGVRP